MIGVFCFPGTRAQWFQCILKITFKFVLWDGWSQHEDVSIILNQKLKSLVPKVHFAVGRIKSESGLRNTEYEGAWKIEGSSFFHSLIVWGKKKLLTVSVIIMSIWWGKFICLIIQNFIETMKSSKSSPLLHCFKFSSNLCLVTGPCRRWLR